MSFDAETFVADFSGFSSASSVGSTLEYFANMCQCLQISPQNSRQFLDRVRSFMSDSKLFRVRSLVQKFDRRFALPTYCRSSAVEDANVLIIGAGPAGLRAAIECSFVGCKNVVVIEKRSEFSRNNIVHLWPFVIKDLTELGAKIFFPKFCMGDLDHISIKLLQIILLKVALLLGVRLYSPCEFVGLDAKNCEPIFNPATHELSLESFDVIVGASGAQCVLPGFQIVAEDRRALAIGITANFKNHNTLPEQQASEITGVARQFNAQFFEELNTYSGIDLENVVYYKGDTHFFVCTARKASLLMKGVLIHDFPEAERLLAKSNVSHFNLCNYIRELANICTAMTIPDLEYELYDGVEDTSVHDFTSSCYAKYSSRAIIRPDGRRLLMCLVGDSLRLPSWPEGTGCPRAFLSGLDTAWLVQTWFSSQVTSIECLALRECVYGLYSSTKPDVLLKNFADVERYTLDPRGRYRQLDLTTAHLHLPKASALIDGDIVMPDDPFAFLDGNNSRSNNTAKPSNGSTKRSSESSRANIPDKVYKWCLACLLPYGELLPGFENDISFADGMALCCLLHSIRPSAVDLFAVSPGPLAVETFLNAMFREFTIAPQLTASELMTGGNEPALVRMLQQLYIITNHPERAAAVIEKAAAARERRQMNTAAKAAILRQMGQEIRQQYKQTPVEQVIFGERRLSLEEKKLKLKELFITGQMGQQAGTPAPQQPPPTPISREEFEERKGRLRDLLLNPESVKSEQPQENAKVAIEVTESVRDRREFLIRKILSANEEPVPKPDHQKVSRLPSSSFPVPAENTGPSEVSLAIKKAVAASSFVRISDEQKKIAAALFEARLKGQRHQSDKKEGRNKGPPPVPNVPHLTVRDRKKQLINSRKEAYLRSTRPPPDESAHIPVHELRGRLATAGDYMSQKSAFDPSEKSQMSISDLAKRLANSTQTHQADRHLDYQVVNQDYQPCCSICADRLYVTERMQVGQYAVHRECFRCVICRHLLRWTSYATVETRKKKRTIFVCPSHVENKGEIEEYLARTSEKIGQIYVEGSKKPAPQITTTIPATVQSTSERPSTEEDFEDAEEELYFEDDEDEDGEELESSVSSNDEESDVESAESDEESETEEEKVENEEEKVEVMKLTEQNKDGELRGGLKIDSWLHQQLIQHRQEKLLLAKQAFLGGPAPAPAPNEVNGNKRSLGSEQKTNQLSAYRGELVMECDSDAAIDESNAVQKKTASEDHAKGFVKEPIIASEQVVPVAKPELFNEKTSKEVDEGSKGEPQHHGVREMFSKLFSKSDSDRSKPNSASPKPSPPPSLEIKEISDDHQSEHSDVTQEHKPKWRLFANSLLSGHWPRSPTKSTSSNSAENSVPLSPTSPGTGNGNGSQCETPKNKPDSSCETPFGSNNGNQLSPGQTAEDAMLAATEKRLRALSQVVSSEDKKEKTPTLVKEAIRLISELDKLEAERCRTEEDISLIERQRPRHHHNSNGNGTIPQALQEALNRRSEISKRHSELLLKAKVIEIESDMDDLMRKYLLTTQSKNGGDSQSPEQLMHQIAALASDREAVVKLIEASNSNKQPEGASLNKPTILCTSV